jgi:hypothetical protein
VTLAVTGFTSCRNTGSASVWHYALKYVAIVPAVKDK